MNAILIEKFVRNGNILEMIRNILRIVKNLFKIIRNIFKMFGIAAGCVGGAPGNQRRPRMLPLMQRLDVEEQMDQVN